VIFQQLYLCDLWSVDRWTASSCTNETTIEKSSALGCELCNDHLHIECLVKMYLNTVTHVMNVILKNELHKLDERVSGKLKQNTSNTIKNSL
jgi:hypothetical protein